MNKTKGAMGSVLRAENLQFGFDFPLTNALSFVVNPGEFIFVAGPNGCGKTTFMRVCSGFHRPLSGSVKVLGRDLQEVPPRERGRLVARVRQTLEVPGKMSVFDFVMLARSTFGGGFGGSYTRDSERVEHALSAVEAIELKDRSVGSLSDGERSRVLLAEALSRRTPLLLLDEPDAFLDIQRSHLLFELFQKLTDEGRTIIVSSHEVPRSIEFAQKILAFDGYGSAVFGTPKEIQEIGALDWAK